MKKPSIITIIFLMLTLVITACSGSQERKNEAVLIVGTDPTFPPFESISAKGITVGLDIDLAVIIAEKLNKKLLIRNLEFDALLFGLKQKKVDMVISGLSITPERSAQVAMLPYQGEDIDNLFLVFWKREPINFEEFEGSIAVQTGTFHESFLRAISVNKNITIKPFTSVQELILEIRFGKSGAALLEPSVLQLMNIRFPELTSSLVPLGDEFSTQGYGLAIRKDNHKLIGDVEKILAELKENGTIKKLEEKWLYSPSDG